jgi:blue light- and temperature-responsive anti-repressor
MTAPNMMTAHDLLVRFQPMLAIGSSQPFAWSAIAHGACGRSFSALAGALPHDQRQALEATRITRAIEAAVDGGLVATDAMIAVPVGAAAGDAEQLLSHLFRTALEHGVPARRIVVEISADERADFACAAALARACNGRGIAIALDAFTAGPLGLKLLARFTPRFVKLDPALVRGIDGSTSRRLIAEGVLRLARNMGVTVVARGAQTAGEHAALERIGMRYVQFEMATAPIQPRVLRREPRAALAPEHRRLAHHQRAAAAPRADLLQPIAVAAAL